MQRSQGQSHSWRSSPDVSFIKHAPSTDEQCPHARGNRVENKIAFVSQSEFIESVCHYREKSLSAMTVTWALRTRGFETSSDVTRS